VTSVAFGAEGEIRIATLRICAWPVAFLKLKTAAAATAGWSSKGSRRSTKPSTAHATTVGSTTVASPTVASTALVATAETAATITAAAATTIIATEIVTAEHNVDRHG